MHKTDSLVKQVIDDGSRPWFRPTTGFRVGKIHVQRMRSCLAATRSLLQQKIKQSLPVDERQIGFRTNV